MSDNSKAVAVRDAGAVIESVITKGDLDKMTPVERARYYVEVCRSLGLNPLTQPFAYIHLNNKLTLYATRAATDQLRRIHNVSCTIVSRERQEDVYIVTARAEMPNGRTDESIGAVSVGGLKGDSLANALMKAETKAKRRATLAIVGLGWLDESETETIPSATTLEPTAAESAEIARQAETPVSRPEKSVSRPAPPTSTKCVDCGGQILALKTRAGTYSAEEMSDRTFEAFGRRLCFKCGEAEKAKRQREHDEQPRQPDSLDQAIAEDSDTHVEPF